VRDPGVKPEYLITVQYSYLCFCSVWRCLHKFLLLWMRESKHSPAPGSAVPCSSPLSIHGCPAQPEAAGENRSEKEAQWRSLQWTESEGRYSGRTEAQTVLRACVRARSSSTVHVGRDHSTDQSLSLYHTLPMHMMRPRQCLVPSKFQKFYKIPCHIKSLDICIDH
jgi:hypothetical protein